MEKQLDKLLFCDVYIMQGIVWGGVLLGYHKYHISHQIISLIS